MCRLYFLIIYAWSVRLLVFFSSFASIFAQMIVSFH